VQDVLQLGLLPRLVELLTAEDVKLQFESAWAITNIASTEATRAVVSSGAIAPLVAGMMSTDANVREQCMWCIGNITGDSSEYRDIMFETENAVNNLLLNIQHPETVGLLRNATWALSNFCRGRPSPSAERVAGLLPPLAYLISMEDKDVVSDALWGLCYLTESDESNIDALLADGVLARCVELLGHAELTVMMPALRVIGNIISGSELQTQAALEAGALCALVPLLKNARRNVRREACWAVSNVAAGTKPQISMLLATPGMIEAVLEQVKNAEWHVRKEAAWIFCNIATAGNAEHVCKIVASRVIPPLVDIMSNDDSRMICVVMDAVNAILKVEKQFADSGNPAAALCRFAEQFEEAGGVQRLEELQEHACDDVFEKARDLVDQYFSSSDASLENTDVVHTVPASSGSKVFAFGAHPGSILVKPSSTPGKTVGFGGTPSGALNFGTVAFA
jgi:importin subunit alpha-1